ATVNRGTMEHHGINHRPLAIAITINIPRHVNWLSSLTPNMTPSAGPTFEPTSMRAFAVPRRRSGKTAAIILEYAGYATDSPAPSTRRKQSIVEKLLANPVRPVAPDQIRKPAAYNQFTFQRSMAGPASNCVNAYVREKAASRTPSCCGLKWSSVWMLLAATPRLPRSAYLMQTEKTNKASGIQCRSRGLASIVSTERLYQSRQSRLR